MSRYSLDPPLGGLTTQRALSEEEKYLCRALDAERSKVAKLEAAAKEDSAVISRCLQVNEKLRADKATLVEALEAMVRPGGTPTGRRAALQKARAALEKVGK